MAIIHRRLFDSDAIGMNAFLDGAIVLVAMVCQSWPGEPFYIPKPPSWGFLWGWFLIGFCSSIFQILFGCLLTQGPSSILNLYIYMFEPVWIGGLEFLNPLQMMDYYKRWLPIEFGYSTVCYTYTHCFFGIRQPLLN